MSELQNIYPSKMNGALIRAMIAFAELSPEHCADAMKIAKSAADFMISDSQPEGAPLAGFPPTYRQIAAQSTINRKSIEYAGQNMLIYPALMGNAYLALHKACGDAKYLDAALRIARTYKRLQLPDGTWYIKMWEKDGSPVVEGDGDRPVKLIPFDVIGFLDRLHAATGDASWRSVADRAMKFIDDGPLKTWDWSAQFEDTPPSANYRNLSSDPTCDLALVMLDRYPGDKRRLAQVRDLIRWSEDQFICWRRPFHADGRGMLAEDTGGIYNPLWNGASETRRFDSWIDVPCSTEKYHWYIGIGGKTAKVAMLFAKMYEAEGNPLDLAKARTLCDAVVRVQAMGGGYDVATHWRVQDLHLSPADKARRNWTNCDTLTALGLKAVAAVADAEEKRAAVKPEVIRVSTLRPDPEDATEAIQKALDAGARYVVFDRAASPYVTRPLFVRSNTRVAFEEGVELLAKEGEFKDRFDALVTLHGVTNVVLRGLGKGATLRMRIKDYQSAAYVHGEWRHAVNLLSAGNVTVQNLTLADSGGDGIYVGAKPNVTPCRDITIRDCVCDNNNRQGISVISVDGLLI
ncbi:MAG: right-handed parallel beta-helix repeat-containing protein, partial [Kiritimatiellae bacterium]|nr:right-handed parallel beta-helix repeat-containing protein [Kiritimatiellia bacterium]